MDVIFPVPNAFGTQFFKSPWRLSYVREPLYPKNGPQPTEYAANSPGLRRLNGSVTNCGYYGKRACMARKKLGKSGTFEVENQETSGP